MTRRTRQDAASTLSPVIARRPPKADATVSCPPYSRQTRLLCGVRWQSAAATPLWPVTIQTGPVPASRARKPKRRRCRRTPKESAPSLPGFSSVFITVHRWFPQKAGPSRRQDDCPAEGTTDEHRWTPIKWDQKSGIWGSGSPVIARRPPCGRRGDLVPPPYSRQTRLLCGVRWQSAAATPLWPVTIQTGPVPASRARKPKRRRCRRTPKESAPSLPGFSSVFITVHRWFPHKTGARRRALCYHENH